MRLARVTLIWALLAAAVFVPIAAAAASLCLNGAVGKAGVDLGVELVDDLDRRVLGRTDAEPCAGLVTRQKIANGR